MSYNVPMLRRLRGEVGASWSRPTLTRRHIQPLAACHALSALELTTCHVGAAAGFSALQMLRHICLVQCEVGTNLGNPRRPIGD